VHSRYQRRPADLPSLGRAVQVRLHVRRFYCRNPVCARQTFAERVSPLVVPCARRTCRLAEAGRTGAALGGEAGARLLSMPASADTVLRLLDRMPMPDQTEPRVIGVDDWAEWPKVPRALCVEWPRRGNAADAATARSVVDLEQHRVVDLLPDRTTATWVAWLRQRPGSRWSHATARRSMPVVSRSARQRRSKLRIGAVLCSCCDRRNRPCTRVLTLPWMVPASPLVIDPRGS